MLPSDSVPQPGEVTRMLRLLAAGGAPEPQQAMGLVHAELRVAAARLLRREQAGHTLQPTDLVHEAWVRLVSDAPDLVADRQHFMGLAARVMRRVLVDHARKRLAAKRGGGELAASLSDVAAPAGVAPEELLALDAALGRLGESNPRLREVVEYRFFGGLEETEIAELLGVTVRTVQRDWARARAWLHQALHPEEAGDGR